jgi:hypothetical protein
LLRQATVERFRPIRKAERWGAFAARMMAFRTRLHP